MWDFIIYRVRNLSNYADSIFNLGGNIMDFEVSIKQFGKRVLELKDKISTEEATKTSLILRYLGS